MKESIGPKKKKPYQPPALEHYGKISNFTTGGSSKKTEWSQGMSMMGVEGDWKQSMSKKKNVIKS